MSLILNVITKLYFKNHMKKSKITLNTQSIKHNLI